MTLAHSRPDGSGNQAMEVMVFILSFENQLWVMTKQEVLPGAADKTRSLVSYERPSGCPYGRLGLAGE